MATESTTVTITVYSNPTCFPCRATKRMLDNRNAAYRDVDLSLPEHEDDRARLKDLGYAQFPVVEVQLPDGVDRWSGHVPDKVAAAAYLVTDGDV